MWWGGCVTAKVTTLTSVKVTVDRNTSNTGNIWYFILLAYMTHKIFPWPMYVADIIPIHENPQKYSRCNTYNWNTLQPILLTIIMGIILSMYRSQILYKVWRTLCINCNLYALSDVCLVTSTGTHDGMNLVGILFPLACLLMGPALGIIYVSCQQGCQGVITLSEFAGTV